MGGGGGFGEGRLLLLLGQLDLLDQQDEFLGGEGVPRFAEASSRPSGCERSQVVYQNLSFHHSQLGFQPGLVVGSRALQTGERGSLRLKLRGVLSPLPATYKRDVLENLLGLGSLRRDGAAALERGSLGFEVLILGSLALKHLRAGRLGLEGVRTGGRLGCV